MLANTTKTVKLQWFSINLFPLSGRTSFPHLMASLCREPRVYSRQKSGQLIVKGWITAHCTIRLSSTSSSLAMAWRRNGRMGERLRSLGECFLSPVMNSLKPRESKSHTRAHSVFQGFCCSMITENYGYQVATFAALTISGFIAFRQNLTLINYRHCQRFVLILTDIVGRCLLREVQICTPWKTWCRPTEVAKKNEFI